MYGPLAVVALWRSGSTLLQRLLNLHPSIVIFGEHNGFLNGLAIAHGALREMSQLDLAQFGAGYLPELLAARPVKLVDGWSVEWANGITPELRDTAFRQLALDLLYHAALRRPGIRYWGFKEIRYSLGALEFLHALFPDLRIIVLLRSPDGILRSRLGLPSSPPPDPALHAEHLRQELQQLRDLWRWAGAQPGMARMVRYEDLVLDPVAIMARITDWLSLPALDEAAIAETMGQQGFSSARDPLPEGLGGSAVAAGDGGRALYAELLAGCVRAGGR